MVLCWVCCFVEWLLHDEYYNKYKEYKISISRPLSDGSRTRHITNLIKASENKHMFSIDTHVKDKKSNIFNIYIDNRTDKLCCVAWNGHLLKDDSHPEMQ